MSAFPGFGGGPNPGNTGFGGFEQGAPAGFGGFSQQPAQAQQTQQGGTFSGFGQGQGGNSFGTQAQANPAPAGSFGSSAFGSGSGFGGAAATAPRGGAGSGSTFGGAPASGGFSGFAQTTQPSGFSGGKTGAQQSATSAFGSSSVAFGALKTSAPSFGFGSQGAGNQQAQATSFGSTAQGSIGSAGQSSLGGQSNPGNVGGGSKPAGAGWGGANNDDGQRSGFTAGQTAPKQQASAFGFSGSTQQPSGDQGKPGFGAQPGNQAGLRSFANVTSQGAKPPLQRTGTGSVFGQSAQQGPRNSGAQQVKSAFAGPATGTGFAQQQAAPPGQGGPRGGAGGVGAGRGVQAAGRGGIASRLGAQQPAAPQGIQATAGGGAGQGRGRGRGNVQAPPPVSRNPNFVGHQPAGKISMILPAGKGGAAPRGGGGRGRGGSGGGVAGGLASRLGPKAAVDEPAEDAGGRGEESAHFEESPRKAAGSPSGGGGSVLSRLGPRTVPDKDLERGAPETPGARGLKGRGAQRFQRADAGAGAGSDGGQTPSRLQSRVSGGLKASATRRTSLAGPGGRRGGYQPTTKLPDGKRQRSLAAATLGALAGGRGGGRGQTRREEEEEEAPTEEGGEGEGEGDYGEHEGQGEGGEEQEAGDEGGEEDYQGGEEEAEGEGEGYGGDDYENAGGYDESEDFPTPPTDALQPPSAERGNRLAPPSRFGRLQSPDLRGARTPTPEPTREQRADRFATNEDSRAALQRLRARDDAERERIQALQTDKDAESTRKVGSCEEMCPETERYRREVENDVPRFEQLVGRVDHAGKPLMDHSKAIKKYVRSEANQAVILPREVRTPNALVRTCYYTIQNIMDDETYTFSDRYSYLYDRFRMIQKDVEWNQCQDQRGMQVLEYIVRYFVHSWHVLCENSQEAGVQNYTFSNKLHFEELKKAITALMTAYQAAWKTGGPRSPNEAEFTAYYVLLFSYSIPGAMMHHLTKVPPEVLMHPDVKFAVKVLCAVHNGNYSSVIRLAGQATYLQACLIHTLFQFIRPALLETIVTAYQFKAAGHTMSAEDFARKLAYDNPEDAGTLTLSAGQQYNAQEGVVVLTKNTLKLDELEVPIKQSRLVLDKFEAVASPQHPNGSIVYGGPLPAGGLPWEPPGSGAAGAQPVLLPPQPVQPRVQVQLRAEPPPPPPPPTLDEGVVAQMVDVALTHVVDNVIDLVLNSVADMKAKSIVQEEGRKERELVERSTVALELLVQEVVPEMCRSIASSELQAQVGQEKALREQAIKTAMPQVLEEVVGQVIASEVQKIAGSERQKAQQQQQQALAEYADGLVEEVVRAWATMAAKEHCQWLRLASKYFKRWRNRVNRHREVDRILRSFGAPAIPSRPAGTYARTSKPLKHVPLHEQHLPFLPILPTFGEHVDFLPIIGKILEGVNPGLDAIFWKLCVCLPPETTAHRHSSTTINHAITSSLGLTDEKMYLGRKIGSKFVNVVVRTVVGEPKNEEMQGASAVLFVLPLACLEKGPGSGWAFEGERERLVKATVNFHGNVPVCVLFHMGLDHTRVQAELGLTLPPLARAIPHVTGIGFGENVPLLAALEKSLECLSEQTSPFHQPATEPLPRILEGALEHHLFDRLRRSPSILTHQTPDSVRAITSAFNSVVDWLERLLSGPCFDDLGRQPWPVKDFARDEQEVDVLTNTPEVLARARSLLQRAHLPNMGCVADVRAFARSHGFEGVVDAAESSNTESAWLCVWDEIARAQIRQLARHGEAPPPTLCYATSQAALDVDLVSALEEINTVAQKAAWMPTLNDGRSPNKRRLPDTTSESEASRKHQRLLEWLEKERVEEKEQGTRWVPVTAENTAREEKEIADVFGSLIEELRADVEKTKMLTENMRKAASAGEIDATVPSH